MYWKEDSGKIVKYKAPEICLPTYTTIALAKYVWRSYFGTLASIGSLTTSRGRLEQ